MLLELFDRRRISLNRGAVFGRVPGAVGLEGLRTHQRIEGMIVGLAVGDALGHSTEWQFDPERRNREFGTIVDHVGTYAGHAGRISDDTQLSLWTLERLLDRGSFDVEDLTRCFVRRRDKVVGIGKNTTAALARHRERLRTGQPEFQACVGDPNLEGRGNGALMRFSPLLLPHLKSPSIQLWTDVTLASLITHGHSAALSSSLAFSHLLWEILRRPVGDAPAPEWWLDEYVKIAHDLEPAALPCPLNTDPIPKAFLNFRGTLCDFVNTKVRDMWRQRVSLRDACSLNGFGSRADILQTVPAVLYVLMSHADSFESALIAAVNDTKDNDTIASIVGAILGALHGCRAIRRKWIEGIRSRSLSVDGGLFLTDDRTMIAQFASDAGERFGGP